jgi:hypothetical protein
MGSPKSDQFLQNICSILEKNLYAANWHENALKRKALPARGKMNFRANHDTIEADIG